MNAGPEREPLPEIATALRETWRAATGEVRLAERALAAAEQSLEAARSKADEIRRQLEVASSALGLDAATLLAVDHRTDDAPAPSPSGPAPAGANGRVRYDERVTDLLADGRLTAGEKLRTVHHGREHFARLEANGFITGPQIGSKPTLSAAARALAGGERNGWKFWTVLRNGTWRPLADLRRY